MNGQRKLFPNGTRIIEAIFIAMAPVIILSILGYFFALPTLSARMEEKVNNICSSVAKLEGKFEFSISKMTEQIVALQIKDQQHEGDINLLKWSTGIPLSKKKMPVPERDK